MNLSLLITLLVVIDGLFIVHNITDSRHKKRQAMQNHQQYKAQTNAKKKI